MIPQPETRPRDLNRTLLPLIEAEFVRYRLLAERAMRQLRPGELHERGNHGNSIAIIVWHLSGNFESKFTNLLTTDGEKSGRNRDSEFELRDVSPAEVAGKWERGWRVLFGALAELTDDDLAAPITIRGVPFRVDEALLRSLAQRSVGRPNPGRKSRKSNEDCTICVSSHRTGSCWTVLRKRENRT